MVKLGLMHVPISIKLGAFKDDMVYIFVLRSTSRIMVVASHMAIY